MKACLAAPERTDDEIIRKGGCITGFELLPLKCGALDLTTLHAERTASLDIAKIKTRIEAKAVAVIARQVKAAADAEALAKRCVGPNVLVIAVNLKFGRDLDPTKMRHCKYEVSFGTVETTTRDGWTIVAIGDMRVAFKTAKRRADGSYLQTKGTATYLGLGTFNLVGGGSSTIATFRLSE